MKLIKKLLGIISLVLIFGGLIVLFFTYFRNKALLEVLVANSIVRGSMQVLKIMAASVIAIIVGLLFFSFFLKAGSVVRRMEREKEEALLEQQRASEEMNRQLREEAEEAKAEAERAKKENELMKMTFMPKKEEDTAEAISEEEQG